MKNDLEQLLVKMEACTEAGRDATAKAKASEDEATKSGFVAVGKAKAAEFAELESELSDLKAKAKADASMKDIRDMLEPAPPDGLNVNPDKTPGELEAKAHGNVNTAQSYIADQNLRMGLFGKAMASCLDPNCLSGNEVNVMFAKSGGSSPTDRMANRGDGSPILMLPRSLVQLLYTQNPTGYEGIDRAKAQYYRHTTGGSTDSGSGNLIAENFIPQVLAYDVDQPTYFDMTTKVNAHNGTFTISQLDQTQGKFGGISFVWGTTEGTAQTETTATYAKFTGQAYSLTGMMYVSLAELRRSEIALEPDLVMRMRSAVKYEISRVVKFGDGSSKPTGLLNASGIKTLARQIAGEVSWKDIVGLEYKITMALRRNAQYIMDDSVEAYLKQYVDTDKRPVFVSDVNSGMKNMIGGYRYEADEHGADEDTPAVLGVEGDLMFGNLKNYAIGVEEEIGIARSEHYKFAEGDVALRLMMWVGGKPIWDTAFAMLTDAA